MRTLCFRSVTEGIDLLSLLLHEYLNIGEQLVSALSNEPNAPMLLKFDTFQCLM